MKELNEARQEGRKIMKDDHEGSERRTEGKKDKRMGRKDGKKNGREGRK